MMRNRTKSIWFPAALAIAFASVVSPTVDGGIGKLSRKPEPDKTVPSPPFVPMIAHGNNGAPPPPDIAGKNPSRDRTLVPEGDLIDDMIDELIEPGPSSNLPGRFGSSEPGALRVSGLLPRAGVGGPSFFAPHVGGSPIGQPMGAIPSPGTLALLGLSALALARRRRRT